MNIENELFGSTESWKLVETLPGAMSFTREPLETPTGMERPPLPRELLNRWTNERLNQMVDNMTVANGPQVNIPPGGLGRYHIWFDRASGDTRVDRIPDAAFYKTHEPALLDE